MQEGAGVSRDEVAAALLTVNAGKIPLDRLALKELVNEVRMWPFLDADDELKAEQEAVSNYEGITDTGIVLRGGGGGSRWSTWPCLPIMVPEHRCFALQCGCQMLPGGVGWGGGGAVKTDLNLMCA